MEGTGRFEGWKEICEPVREPTDEDLLWAERTEAGKIRYVRAVVQCFLPPFALQTAFNSHQYDEDVPFSALHAMMKLMDVVNTEVATKMKEVVQDGPLAKSVPWQPKLVQRQPITWTPAQEAPKTQP